MADNDKQEAGESKPKKSKGGKGPIKLLAGVVILIASGAGIAMMAIPEKEKGPMAFGGPWSLKFFETAFVANTADDNFSRYLKFEPLCNYFAYEQPYVEARKLDQDFLSQLQEAFAGVVASYKLNGIMVDGSGENMAIAAQLEQAAEPILFPVHIGETVNPLDVDAESGLRPGDSQDRHGTFRGPYLSHLLHVDGAAMTIRLDDGMDFPFAGDEGDLQITGSDGRKVYLDVTHLTPDFMGEVNVGVKGRIRTIHLGNKMAQ